MPPTTLVLRKYALDAYRVCVYNDVPGIRICVYFDRIRG